jgi:hypothetical protein
MDHSQAPLIIGATGGSGAYPVTRICQLAGCYMGSQVNAVLDAESFVPFYDAWVGRSLSGEAAALPQKQHAKMFQDFMVSIQRHRAGIPAQTAPWGWKNERSMYLVPFFHAIYRGMKFIHIVRDGRDIAFLKNPGRILMHTKAFFNRRYDSLPQPMRLILLWQATNLTMASYCEANMPGNYLRIRYEDLCENPQGIIKKLLNFISVPSSELSHFAAAVSSPDSIGRWHIFPVDLVQQVESLGREALLKFGYL